MGFEFLDKPRFPNAWLTAHQDDLPCARLRLRPALAQDTEFGFPDENYFSDQGAPQSKGLDTRNDEAVQMNPRVQSSVTEADVQQSYDRIKLLSSVTFDDSFEDRFDAEVRGKGREFRDALWARLQEETE